MATYLHPGVYVEEIPSGSKPIEGVATSVAAFVGYTTKGPLGEPVRITKYDSYKDQFSDQVSGILDTGTDPQGDPVGHSVLAFFQNGGTTAYIVRITKDFGKSGQDARKAVGFTDHPSADNTTHAFKFTAVNEGAWANGLVAKFTALEVGAEQPPVYKLEIGRKDEKGNLVPFEVFGSVSLDEDDPQYIENVVNGFSQLVEVKMVPLSEVEVTQETLLLGTSTSGDLSALTLPLELTSASEEDRTLRIKLDDGAVQDFVLTAEEYADLETLAVEIEAVVRGDETTEPRASFTCSVQESDGETHLVLTSGSRTPESAVVVSDFGLAAMLSLGVDHDGEEKTGAETAAEAWASPVAPAEDEAMLGGGANGSKPVKADYDAIFSKFVKIREITTMLLPGLYWADNKGKDVIESAIAHAEHMKNRMVLVDPPVDTELTTPKGVTDIGLPTSTYTVLYYPWVKVANPLYHPETNPGPPDTVLVPPSGFAAGMWSKIDGHRGVWKAPAGVEARLLGVAGLQYQVENGEQDVLNPLGVNAIRAQPGFGPVIWGARTLSTKADPEWRYVPVRRTAIMIEQSIYEGIQWAVFEANDHRLWASLRLNIESFMNGLFRAGAFQGEKASDAYFVRCGLGDTMTQDDIDRGQVIVIVGFAPLKPAEFVIVRIQQKVGQQ